MYNVHFVGIVYFNVCKRDGKIALVPNGTRGEGTFPPISRVSSSKKRCLIPTTGGATASSCGRSRSTILIIRRAR